MSKLAQGSSKASSSKPLPFKQKTIQHTQDLLKANVKAKGNGKGKERAILGEVADLLGRECCDILQSQRKQLMDRDKEDTIFNSGGTICGGTTIGSVNYTSG
jgi:hypothetical protein